MPFLGLCVLYFIFVSKNSIFGIFHRFYIGCMGFPDCRGAVWLPESVIEASVSDQTCQRVSNHLSHVMRKSHRSGANQAVQAQKMARGWKLWI